MLSESVLAVRGMADAQFDDARDASLVAAREVLAFVRAELDKVF